MADQPRKSVRAPGGCPARLLLLLLLGTQTALLLHAAWTDSVVVDEAGQLASGLVHWVSGDFRPYHVNPPLLRLAGTAPVLLFRPAVPLPKYQGFAGERPEALLANQFAHANAGGYVAMVRVGRLATIALTLLASWLLWDLGRETHGETGGMVVVGMWVFCPLALGHGHFLTMDMGAAAFGLLAYRAFTRYLSEGTPVNAAGTGFALGLAVMAKFTLLIFLPLFLVWALLEAWARRASWRRLIFHLAIGAAVWAVVVHACYGFPRPVTWLKDFRFVSLALGGQPMTAEGANRFQGTALGWVPVPLPEEMVLGIDVQRSDFERTLRSYLRGEHRQGGWWYYYLYALLVKLPVGHLVLVLAGVVATVIRLRTRKGFWRPWVPGLLLLTLVSSQTGFSHHLRYCLPALPFLYLGAGAVVWPGGKIWLQGVAVVALFVSAASTLANHPHHVAYFNELAGGPANGHAHLLDSNLDWGQDLLRLRDWLDEHPEARPIYLAAAHAVDPGVFGITYRLPPREPASPEPGWYVFSINILQGYDYVVYDGQGMRHMITGDCYAQFRSRQPVARVGRSLWVFRVDGEQAASPQPAVACIAHSARLGQLRQPQDCSGRERPSPGRLLQPAPEQVRGGDAESSGAGVGRDHLGVGQNVRAKAPQRQRQQPGRGAVQLARPAVADVPAQQTERDARPAG